MTTSKAEAALHGHLEEIAGAAWLAVTIPAEGALEIAAAILAGLSVLGCILNAIIHATAER